MPMHNPHPGRDIGIIVNIIILFTKIESMVAEQRRINR